MGNINDIFITESDFRARYQYDENDLLGEGGFAQVYKAFDKQFQEYVALKFYSKGDQGKYDVLHEMKDTRKFSNPNIIRIQDAFVVRFDHAGGHSYVQVGILEFANGGNLRDFIQSGPSEKMFIEVLIGILKGLEYLHIDKKLIHRDLSPENILMYHEEDIWIPKIADFGISKRIAHKPEIQEKNKSTQLLGKVDYMAPEQFYPEKFGIDGRINTNVDLWAFGIILYELFLQKLPFGQNYRDNPLGVIQSITNDPVTGLEAIPEPYGTIIKKCLVKNASSRVKNAGELIPLLHHAVQRKSASQPVRTMPIEGLDPAHKKSNLGWLVLSIVFLLIVAAYFVFRPAASPKTIVPPGPDASTIKEQMNSLLNEKKYKSIADRFIRLPDSLKDHADLRKIYFLSLRALQLDSLLLHGNQWFLKKNYDTALILYQQVITDYDPSNNFVRNRIDSIHSLLKMISTSRETNTGFYPGGKFTVTTGPATSSIALVSIQITGSATIIILRLVAGESMYFSSPGNPGAYYLEFGKNRKRLNLKDITGIKTGSFVIDENDKQFKLYFNKIPDDVTSFDLINGDNQFHRDYKTADFKGIVLNK